MSREVSGVVALSLDVLVTPHGVEPHELQPEPLAGATYALDCIKQMAGRSVLLAAEDVTTASDMLGQAGCAVDEVYGECVTRRQKAATLARLGAWAYVGNQLADMGAARMADVRAIGVASGAFSAKQLRQAGADYILRDLEELPGVLRHTSPQYLSRAEVADRLSMHLRSVSTAFKGGSFPRVQAMVPGLLTYPSSFAERVITFTQGAKPTFKQLSFCYLGWASAHGSFAEFKHAGQKLQELVRDGEVLVVHGTAALLGYDQRTVRRWARDGFLPAITARGQCYSRKQDVEYVRNILNSHTAYEVATRLGITKPSVTRIIKRGELAAAETPNGLRVSESAVRAYLQKRDSIMQVKQESWRASKVREVLGISQTTLSKWCDRGLLSFQTIDRKRQFDPGSVQDLRLKLLQLNPGFEWLQPAVPMCTAPRAGRMLGIAAENVGKWAREGLLPFKEITGANTQNNNFREYAAEYLGALAAYAGALPVPKDVARQFKQECSEADAIITEPAK